MLKFYTVFLFWNKKNAIKVFFTSTWNKLFTTLLKPGVGVSLFTGRMKVFLLISAAGARLLSPRNAIQKQIHTSTHTLWLKMSTKQRLNWANITGTHSKAVKNFLWSLTWATCAVQPTLGCRIGCRLLSRPEGLGPEIAPKSPEENKQGSWLLRRNLKVYLTFFILHILGLDLRFQDTVLSESQERVGFNVLQLPNRY